MSLRLSMVSHGQSSLANRFLQDLQGTPGLDELVVTENIPDLPMVMPDGLACQRHVNEAPMGFAENHNRAFGGCHASHFCVANPDLRLTSNPFPGLLAAMQDPTVGLVAPLVLSPAGQPEDNARRFPTP